MLVRPIVGDRVVQGADVVPHQHVTLGPAVRVLVLRLELVGEQGSISGAGIPAVRARIDRTSLSL